MRNQRQVRSDTPPTAAEVEAELDRVLASRMFEQSARASDFLRFVVTETLAGRSDRLKGYTIAVHVFGRPATFDAQSDPLVRVEAGRLRRRLMEYYHDVGKNDPVRIELAPGGYAPTFAHARRAAAPESVRPSRRRLFLLASAAATMLALAGVLLTWLLYDRAPTVASQSPATLDAPRTAPASPRGPRMLVLPFANLSGDPEVDAFASGLTEETISALVAFNIFATASSATTDVESTALQALRVDFDVGYVVSGSVRMAEGRTRIGVRLTDTQLGTQLWTTTFDESSPAAGAVALQERVGRAIAEFLSSPFGPVYEHEIERTASKPVDDLDPYECLLRFYAYARFFDAAGHATSVRCMQRAVVSEPRFATAWSALAVLYLHEHTFGYDPQPDRGPALARALEAVRTALDIDGSGRVAATSIVSVRLAEGDHAGYQQAVERALAIVPSHPAVGLQIGYSLTLAGEWERGAALLDASRPTTPNVPGWVEIGYAFRYLQTQDYDEALEWALRSDAPNWFVAPMTVAAAAALAGRNDIAQREAKRLLELYPDFERVGREQLGRWNMSTPLLTALLDGLRSAGLRIT